MTRTVFFSFKPSREMTKDSIDDLLRSNGFERFKILLPKERSFSGRSPSLKRGFVFIRFHARSDALRLIETMNGQTFFGGKLKISMKEDEENAYDSDERLSGSDAVEYEYNSD